MSSFLEQINRDAESGFVKAPKASAKKPAAQSEPQTAAKGAVRDTAKPEPAQRTEEAAVEAPAPRPVQSVRPAPRPVQSAQAAERAGINSTEHEVEIDRNYGKRNFIRIVLTAVICLLLIAGAVAAFRYFTMVELPDFEGKTIAEMRKWCIDNKLYLSEISEYSMDTDEDFVISQSVPGGTRVAPKKTVEVVFSLGPDPSTPVKVPDLMSMTAPEIRSWADENKLANLKIYEEYATDEKGKILRYTFGSVSVDESNFKRGDTLTVYISRGPADSYSARTLPNFLNKTRTEVESWCSNYGMKAVFTETLSTETDAGRVISQSLDPASRIESGTTIEFVISSGAGALIPDFSKLYKEDAPTAAAGLNVRISLVYSDTVAYGGFISQSREAGLRVDSTQSDITVVYSIGRPYIPSLTGMNESEIPALFYDFNRSGAALSYKIIYMDSAMAKGTVIDATHRSEYVGLNETVTLQISRGNLKQTDTPVNPDPLPELVTVPDYSKVLKENAASLNPKVMVTVKTVYSDTVPYGGFISQSVTAGMSMLPENAKVTVVYSAGKPYLESLAGKNESILPALFYEYKLMDANLTYQIVYVSSTEPKGTIISASKSNEYVSVNEVITITVSLG